MIKQDNRLILHCDLNNFYASVECLVNPTLRDSPVAVAGSADRRHGVVLAKNELAKKKGIKTGDVVWEAKQKEPELIIVPPNFSLYSQYSKQVFDLYTFFTPFVEPFGPDECWLDLTNCPGCENPLALGNKIREEIKNKLKLTISVGVSFTKTLSKIASDLKKPDGTTLATRGNYKETIWPLPINEMFMVGKRTAQKLQKIGVNTIGALARCKEEVLHGILGINGIKLKKNALGEDYDPVRCYVESHENKSVGHGMTTMRDITTINELKTLILYLCERISVRLRRYKKTAFGVAVNLRFNTLEHESAQTRFAMPTSNSTEMAATALELAKTFWNENLPLRTVSISAYDLQEACGNAQISLFENKDHIKNDSLDLAVEKIRNKFGESAIVRGSMMGCDFIYDKKDDEDFLPFKR